MPVKDWRVVGVWGGHFKQLGQSLCNSSNWKDNDRDSGRGEKHGPIQVRQKDSGQQERRRARADEGKGFKDGSGKEEQTDGSTARVYKTDRRKLRKDPMRKDKDK